MAVSNNRCATAPDRTSCSRLSVTMVTRKAVQEASGVTFLATCLPTLGRSRTSDGVSTRTRMPPPSVASATSRPHVDTEDGAGLVRRPDSAAKRAKSAATGRARRRAVSLATRSRARTSQLGSVSGAQPSILIAHSRFASTAPQTISRVRPPRSRTQWLFASRSYKSSESSWTDSVQTSSIHRFGTCRAAATMIRFSSVDQACTRTPVAEVVTAVPPRSCRGRPLRSGGAASSHPESRNRA